MRHYAVSALGCLMHMERVVSADKTLQNMLRLCNIFRDVVIQLTLFYFFLQDNLIFFSPPASIYGKVFLHKKCHKGLAWSWN